MFAQIALLTPPWTVLSYALPGAFSPDFWKPGMRVAVPLGKRSLRAGIIMAITNTADLPGDTVCKDICWPLETTPVIDDTLVALVNDLALRQCLAPGFIFGHVLPAGLRRARIKARQAHTGKSFDLSTIAALPQEQYNSLARELLTGDVLIVSDKDGAAKCEICDLRVDPPWPIRPAATRQRAILEYLYVNGSSSRRKLAQALGITARDLQSLAQNGLIAIRFGDDPCAVEETGGADELMPPPVRTIELNPEQSRALADLEMALKSENAAHRLVYGVTGSGKTALYLETIRACLALGRSALLLAPEVALACKLFRDAREALPSASLFLYHGYQQPARRENVFREIAAANTPCVIVGTRSALFLPVKNTGCIILDEEHDGSFKQDEIFAYHAKELAWFRANKDNALLVLGSATPDVKTFHAAESGALPRLVLAKRVEGRQLPPVELVSMAAQPGTGSRGSLAALAAGEGLLAPQSEEALQDCLRNGQQAVILLNRRGYSPLIYCVDCGKVLHCPHCEIGLAYHKNLLKLVCHYCGFTLPYPSPCPKCGKMNFLAIGEGTERIAERLEAMTGKPVLRLDRDSTRRAGSMEEILQAFGRGESPFLVGTQMLSKGHHFPNVTLVVVADGDIGLNLPDYRAAERTFQLLVQAAGRAGRGSQPGRVLIQTRDKSHYCWNYIPRYDYNGFYREELARRKRGNYPPFTRLALLRISFPNSIPQAMEELSALSARLKGAAKTLDVRLLGPAPAPIPMLRGQRRYQCLLKSSSWNNIRQLYSSASHWVSGGNLRLFLDIDPVNML